MKKIKIGDVVKISITTYKESWRPLLLISLITIGISVLTGIFGIVIKPVKLAELRILLVMVNLIVTLISLYFTSRLAVTMIIAANKLLEGEKVSVAASYQEARHSTWPYIGIALLIGLMLVIPIVFIVFGVVSSIFQSIPFPIGVLLIIMGALAIICLSIIFFFSLPIAVLHPKESVFKASRELVKGNFLQILGIRMIALIVLIPLTIFNYYYNTGDFTTGPGIIYTIAQGIPSMLLMPFVTLNVVVAMRELEEKDDVLNEI